MKIQLRTRYYKDKQSFFISRKNTVSYEYYSIEDMCDVACSSSGISMYGYVSKLNTTVLCEHHAGSILDFFRKARNTHPELFL